MKSLLAQPYNKTLLRIGCGIALSISSFSALAQPQLSDDDKNKLQQAQNLALCAALGNNVQQKEYAGKLLDFLEEGNQKDKKFSREQLIDMSTTKIEQLKRNFDTYSVASRDKLFNKVCPTPAKMNDNFQGLGIAELPKELQQQITDIASCALLSESIKRHQQAQQLTAANTMIVAGAGVNGRNEAVHQLTGLHEKLITEFKTKKQDELKVLFENSCSAVQKLQQQRKNQQTAIQAQEK